MKIAHQFVLALILGATMVLACKKMDSKYRDFVVPGGITYPGKAVKPQVHPGNGRIRFTWLRGNDPKVTRTGIYWNNFSDSVMVPVPAQLDTISYVIQPLNEATYSFTIKTFDDEGNVSVPVEVSGKVFGEVYQASILARPVVTALLDNNGLLNLKWGDADLANGAYNTEVEYTSINGTPNVSYIKADTTESAILDYKAGTTFRYRTAYLPDSMAIDTFYTAYLTNDRLELSKEDWTIVSFSTQHDDGVNSVRNFIDGTDGTRWHSRAGGSNYPHFAVIDMGIERTITQFGVWRTTFENGGDNRAPNVIQFLTSKDNLTWTDRGTYNFNRLINGEQTFVMPANAVARYFKFVAVQGPEANMVVGEISAYGF